MATLTARSNLDSSGFKSGLNQMNGGVSSFSSSLAKIGGLMGAAFSIGKVIQFGASVVQTASQLSDYATQTGISVETFQALDNAARDAGASTDQLRTLFVKLKVAQGEALNGSTEYVQEFERLGISMDQLRGMSSEQIFEQMSIAISKSNNAAEDFSSTFKLLGTRSGPALLEVMNKIGNEGFASIIKGAKDAGTVMDEETIKKLDAVADAWERMKTKAKVAASGIILGMMDAGKAVGRFFASMSGKDFLKSGILWAGFKSSQKMSQENNADKQKQERQALEENNAAARKANEAKHASIKKKQDEETQKRIDDEKKIADERLKWEQAVAERRRDENQKAEVEAVERMQAINEKLREGIKETMADMKVDSLARIGGQIGGDLGDPQIRKKQIGVKAAEDPNALLADMNASAAKLNAKLSADRAAKRAKETEERFPNEKNVDEERQKREKANYDRRRDESQKAEVESVDRTQAINKKLRAGIPETMADMKVDSLARIVGQIGGDLGAPQIRQNKMLAEMEKQNQKLEGIAKDIAKELQTLGALS